METEVARESGAEFSWSASEIRRVGHRVVELIAAHLTELPAGPVFRPVPAELADTWMSERLPERGESADAILDRLADGVSPYPFGNGHPRFYGWVNSPPAVIGVMAEALAAAMNPSVAGGNHAAVWIERQVLEWFKQLVGFPSDSMALLVSGGSTAAVTALAVARHAACARRGWDVRRNGMQTTDPGVSAPRLVVYKGAESHGCNQKAVELLGIGSANIRTVPSDAALRLRPDALDRMIEDDLAAGHIPVAVVASAGTVNTGAIDPLAEVADACARHEVWLHVDAAYGGAAIVTEAYAQPLQALARADSIALDPHKWMYVPVDAGLVLVRHASAMRDAFSLVPPYLRTDGNLHGVQGPTWFSEYGPEQTRPFRALKVWAALRFFGRDGYRRLVEHDLELARHLADRVRSTPQFQLWEPTSLSIVCFRATQPESSDRPADLDSLNRQLLEDVQLGGEGFLSGTMLNGTFWLRACIVNPRASVTDIDAVFDAVQAALRRRIPS
jgi:glutamate/tyrosine decarboxylase-like PLP-dependent enzyme